MRSLRSGFILLCVPAITLTLAGLGYYQYSGQKARLLAELEMSIERATTRLSLNLSEPIWNENVNSVNDQLLVEMRLPDLVGIIVTNETGKVIAAAGQKDGKPVLIELGSTLPSSPLSKYFEIRRSNKIVAHGEVFFRRDELDRRLKSQLLGTLWQILAVDTLLTFLLTLILSATVTRPIQKLTRITGEIARTGNLAQKVETRFWGEVGQLAKTFEQMVQKLQVVPMTVNELTAAVSDLTQLIAGHTEVTEEQASGLAQASATMQELRISSSTAAAKAEAVIAVAKQAENFSAVGQQAVENSINSLGEIQAQVDHLVRQIAALSERTLQVGGIVETVKDLADQSNMLALNASIEAVKAGELGKGFGVVAREIRSLADQSIQATGNIRQVLTEIQRAIRSTVSISDQGKAIMDRSMEQIRASGESLREIAGVVTESSQAARQIAASVNQQDVGIGQISQAIEVLNVSMEKASSGIRLAEQAAANLSDLSDRISRTLTAPAE